VHGARKLNIVTKSARATIGSFTNFFVRRKTEEIENRTAVPMIR